LDSSIEGGVTLLTHCIPDDFDAAFSASRIIGGALFMNSLNTYAISDILRPVSRRNLTIYFAAALCLGLSLATSAEARQLPGVRWIKLVQHESGKFALYHVMLDRRFKVYELDTMARHITRDAPKGQLTFILYFLRGMSSDQGPWATSNFNPSLGTFEIQINEAITATNPPDTDLRTEAQR
jgi:hypothetical protein